MSKEVTKVKKIFCDFCRAETPASTPAVQKEITMADATFIVEIKLSSPEKGKRFPHDICEGCCFKAAEAAAMELPITKPAEAA